MSTLIAGSNNIVDVQSAVNSGVSGDIIVIPPGSVPWGSGNAGLTISSSITVSGSGNGQVLISATNDSSGPLITLGAPYVTFTNVVISGSITKSPTIFSTTNGPFRITNITYAANNSTGYFYDGGAGAVGVIDSCQISGGNGECELIFFRGPTNAWQSPSPVGTENCVFIEDCAFSGPGYVTDANANAACVVRFCTISGQMKIDGHGFDSNFPPRSVRSYEAYNNIWQSNGSFYPAAEMRGGAGFLFNNQLPNQVGNDAWFEIESYGVQDAWSNYGINITGVSTGNPCVITTQWPHGITGSGLGLGWTVYVNSSHTKLNPALDASGFSELTGYWNLSGIDAYNIQCSAYVTGASSGNGYILMIQTPYNYPLPDQIGRGQDISEGPPLVQTSEPMYVWNLSAQNGANWPLLWKTPATSAISLYQQQMSNPNATFTMQTIISGGRDLFLGTGVFLGTGDVGTGTVAQMLALPTTHLQTGVGFWCVDTGNWNQRIQGTAGALFTWSGAWNLAYIPYTYPHPMRGLTFQFPSPRRIGSHPKLAAYSFY